MKEKEEKKLTVIRETNKKGGIARVPVCQYGYKENKPKKQKKETNRFNNIASNSKRATIDSRINYVRSYKFNKGMIQSEKCFHVNRETTGTFIALGIDQ